jgi:hypothetical protein
MANETEDSDVKKTASDQAPSQKGETEEEESDRENNVDLF